MLIKDHVIVKKHNVKKNIVNVIMLMLSVVICVNVNNVPISNKFKSRINKYNINMKMVNIKFNTIVDIVEN